MGSLLLLGHTRGHRLRVSRLGNPYQCPVPGGLEAASLPICIFWFALRSGSTGSPSDPAEDPKWQPAVRLCILLHIGYRDMARSG